MQIICFEDDRVGHLAPIVHARPAYAVTCASFRLIDWLRELSGALSGRGSLVGIVRDYLQTIQSLDFGIASEPRGDDPEGCLIVNARLIPRVATAAALKALAASERSVRVADPADPDVLLAARITAADLAQAAPGIAAENGWSRWLDVARSLPPADPHAFSSDLPFRLEPFRWPHDVIAAHMADMPESMRWRVRHGDYRQLQDGVFVGEGAKIGEYASIHADDHPIILERGVSVGPFCFLEGPLFAGAGTRVIEHAAIKDGVSLGHTVKIGGEVEASVIEPYTNKQHHGFLGHSYLGSWINLGAGTCNSDLKNTYGKINIEYGEHKIATGMQFLGCVMGDYSKTAINTGIFTGKVIGVCSMLYGFVTSNVPSYVNYARLFGQTSLLPPDIMINTQKRMFARRKVEQRECDRQLIRDMYERTFDERESADQLAL